MNSLTPNPDLIGDLFWVVFKPQLIRLALQIDLFSPLSAGPATLEMVATECKCNHKPIRALLDYFCSLHVLVKSGERYALTPTAETFLLPDRKAYAGDMILHYTSHELWDNVLDALRSGNPRWLGENFVQDAWLESYSDWRIPKSLEMWQAVGVMPVQIRPYKILDLASGCGIKSMSLAQVDGNVYVTCLDSTDVLEVAKDLAGRMNVIDRVNFVPGDLLRDDWGQDCFQAVLLGQITDYLQPEQNIFLFCRVHQALTDGGILIIDCPMEGDLPGEMTSLISLFLWANSGGQTYSFETYGEWLEQAGFAKVIRLSDRLLVAKKLLGKTMTEIVP